MSRIFPHCRSLTHNFCLLSRVLSRASNSAGQWRTTILILLLSLELLRSKLSLHGHFLDAAFLLLGNKDLFRFYLYGMGCDGQWRYYRLIELEDLFDGRPAAKIEILEFLNGVLCSHDVVPFIVALEVEGKRAHRLQRIMLI